MHSPRDTHLTRRDKSTRAHGLRSVSRIIGMCQDLGLDSTGYRMSEEDEAKMVQAEREEHEQRMAEAERTGEPPRVRVLGRGVAGPNDYVPSSVLETLALAMEHAERDWPPHMPEAFEPPEEGMPDEDEGLLAKGQRTLGLILREIMNRVEREGLEYGLKRAGPEAWRDDEGAAEEN